MTRSAAGRIIPVLCVAAGVSCALLAGNAFRQTEAGPDLAVKAEFEELPAAEQTLILGKAESLQRRWEANPEEYRRLKDIHDAVTSRPELYDKLVRFHLWWLDLDFGQKSQLKADGKFVVNWPERTQRLYVETQLKPREITIKYIGLTFSEADYQAFLEDVIPDPVPEDLAEVVSELDGSDQQCERILAKSLWLFEHIQRPDFMQRPSRDPKPEKESELTIGVDVVQGAVEEHLVADDEVAREKYQRALANFSRRPGDSNGAPNTGGVYILMLTFVRSAVHHFDNEFRAKHLGDERTGLVTAFASLSEAERSDLLRRDPEDIQRYLRRRVIEEQSAQEKDPAVARLAEKLNRFAKMFSYPSRPRSGRRGDRPPGGGQRGRFSGSRTLRQGASGVSRASA